MPKTIAITPSHYWPRGVPRTVGIPPFPVLRLAVDRWARRQPGIPLLARGDESVVAASLARTVRGAARAIRQRVPVGSRLAVSAGPSTEGATLVLAALASGRETIYIDAGTKTASAASGLVVLGVGDQAGAEELSGACITELRLCDLIADTPDMAGDAGDSPADSASAETGGSGVSGDRAALSALIGFVSGSRIAWHSHRSLASHALSLRVFLDPGGLTGVGPADLSGSLPGTGVGGGSVASTFSPCSWQGLAVLLFALTAGGTWLGCDADGELATTLESLRPEWLAAPLADAVSVLPAGRRARKDRTVQRAALVGIDGTFDPDGPATITRAIGCPALSLFGLPETGPILGSHPSWHLVESAGIPLPNVHVVPTDPRSGKPISTLWELVDAAAITVWSPSVMLGYDAEANADAATGRSFATGMLAAADPNGMLYLLDG